MGVKSSSAQKDDLASEHATNANVKTCGGFGWWDGRAVTVWQCAPPLRNCQRSQFCTAVVGTKSSGLLFVVMHPNNAMC